MRIILFCILTLWLSLFVDATPTAKLESIVAEASHTANAAEASVVKEASSDKKNTEKDTPLPEEEPAHIWNLSNANIRSVIAEVARVTGKNFLIDPRVQGNISIVSAQALTNQEIYPVFLSMLQVAGYAAIPGDNVIKIVPTMEARGETTDELGLHAQKNGDALLVEVVPVRYGSAEQLVPILRSLMPQWSTVSAYAPSNMLILSGRASNIKQLTEIISQVDNSSINGIDIVSLKYALAMDVVTTLKELVKNNQQSTIAADDRSNSILLGGTKPERLKLRLLILQLDKQNQNGSEGNTKVIYLNYLRAEDVVPILAGIAQANFSGTVGTTIGTVSQQTIDSTSPESSLVGNNGGTAGASLGGSASAPPAASQAPTSSQSQGSTKPTIQIIAEPNTNSVIVNAPAAVVRTLQSVISQLDIRPAQLLIEALVAEINENDFRTLGVDWGSANKDVFRPGFAVLHNASISQLQAQIHSLARQRRANILSTPSVVVLDNRQAKILIGKQVSVATSSNQNSVSGTPYTTFDRVNVALHLYVRPQITRGRGIQMQIDQGNDSLDPASPNDSEFNRTFNISAIMTSVHVESGDVIVLGGLAQDSLGNDTQGLPILGDIPGIGRLFQHNITNRDKKILMVFIRPVILRSEHESQHATAKKYQMTRQEELEFARTQEFYSEKDSDAVLPSLSKHVLPRPFAQTESQQDQSRHKK